MSRLDHILDEEWRWPWWKFGFWSNPLFSELHDEFTSMKIVAQDPRSRHRDVSETAKTALKREELRGLYPLTPAPLSLAKRRSHTTEVSFSSTLLGR